MRRGSAPTCSRMPGSGSKSCRKYSSLSPGYWRSLRGLGAVAAQPLRRDRVGHDHAAREPAADHVLEGRPFVVEQVDRGDAQRARDDRQVVRAVGRGEVEAGTAARPAPECGRPPGQAAQLAAGGAAAVRPDRQRVDARELRELERLREVARRDLDFVAGRSQPLHERPEDDRVGGCREVDPDPHRHPPARGVPSVGRVRARSRPDGRGPCARRRALSRAGRCARPGPPPHRSTGARCPRRLSGLRRPRSSAAGRAAPAVFAAVAVLAAARLAAVFLRGRNCTPPPPGSERATR